MTKYKIIKESKALPMMWKVGRELETEVQSNLCWYERPNKAITQEHVNALLELGVVEEVKEWNPRELKRGDRYYAYSPGVYTGWNVCSLSWNEDEGDIFHRATGNCHPTKEIAEQWRDELIKKYNDSYIEL